MGYKSYLTPREVKDFPKVTYRMVPEYREVFQREDLVDKIKAECASAIESGELTISDTINPVRVIGPNSGLVFDGDGAWYGRGWGLAKYEKQAHRLARKAGYTYRPVGPIERLIGKAINSHGEISEDSFCCLVGGIIFLAALGLLISYF